MRPFPLASTVFSVEKLSGASAGAPPPVAPRPVMPGARATSPRKLRPCSGRSCSVSLRIVVWMRVSAGLNTVASPVTDTCSAAPATDSVRLTPALWAVSRRSSDFTG